MEKKQYKRPLSKAVELDGCSMCVESIDLPVGDSVDPIDARANERIGEWEELGDILDF